MFSIVSKKNENAAAQSTEAKKVWSSPVISTLSINRTLANLGSGNDASGSHV